MGRSTWAVVVFFGPVQTRKGFDVWLFEDRAIGSLSDLNVDAGDLLIPAVNVIRLNHIEIQSGYKTHSNARCNLHLR